MLNLWFCCCYTLHFKHEDMKIGENITLDRNLIFIRYFHWEPDVLLGSNSREVGPSAHVRLCYFTSYNFLNTLPILKGLCTISNCYRRVHSKLDENRCQWHGVVISYSRLNNKLHILSIMRFVDYISSCRIIGVLWHCTKILCFYCLTTEECLYKLEKNKSEEEHLIIIKLRSKNILMCQSLY